MIPFNDPVTVEKRHAVALLRCRRARRPLRHHPGWRNHVSDM